MPGEASGAGCSAWTTGLATLERLYDKGGATLLVAIFIAFVFYRLVWKVWSEAMRGKDEEIERLIRERDFYQDRLFPDRISSDQDDKEIT